MKDLLDINTELKFWSYDQNMAALVVKKMYDGWSLTKIGKTDGFPPVSSIYRWIKEKEEFSDAVTTARKAKAEHFLGKAEDIFEESYDIEKDDVAREKFRYEAALKLAGIYNTKYSTKGDGAKTVESVTINVNTGINNEKPLEADVIDMFEHTLDEDQKKKLRIIDGSDSKE